MKIAWLWYYTESGKADALRTLNEDRAFTVYARWRAVSGWTASSYAQSFQYFQQRAARRALRALPDYLLSDIGMYRSGDRIALEKKRKNSFIKSYPVELNSGNSAERIVVPVAPATRNLSDCLSGYDLPKTQEAHKCFPISTSR